MIFWMETELRGPQDDKYCLVLKNTDVSGTNLLLKCCFREKNFLVRYNQKGSLRDLTDVTAGGPVTVHRKWKKKKLSFCGKDGVNWHCWELLASEDS